MKKFFHYNIFLCSNRADRQIPAHGVSCHIFTDSQGFVIFELEETKRDFAHQHVTLAEGCYLLTYDCNCYKIISIVFAEKSPKKAICKTVLTTIGDMPYSINIYFESGEYKV